jgi:hypothetical protein
LAKADFDKNMRLTVSKQKMSMNPFEIARRAGYGLICDRRTGQESLVRHFGRGLYPRFHLYIDDGQDAVVFNLHLDQKQASYAGTHAHNAEYDSEVVEREMERLKAFIG